MKIGYSAWGFCGEGEVNSPDGGRLTRSLFIEHILRQGDEVVWLQKNRDIDECGNNIFSEDNEEYFRAVGNDQYSTLCSMTYDRGTPHLDVLFLEWRWQIPGRNTLSDMGSPDYTDDLDHQNFLLVSYSVRENTKVVIWDKDEKMTIDDEKFIWSLFKYRATILSPALYPHHLLYKRETMLFPCDWSSLVGSTVNDQDCPYFVGYVGSQYERDRQIYEYLNPFASKFNKNNSAEKFPAIFVGNWDKTPEKKLRNEFNFPDIIFKSRILPADMGKIYEKCETTILFCKDNYAKHGHITQRIHEVPRFGVISIGLKEHRGIEQFVGEDMTIGDSYDLQLVYERLINMSYDDRQRLLDRQIDSLKPFDISNTMKVFNNVIKP